MGRREITQKVHFYNFLKGGTKWPETAQGLRECGALPSLTLLSMLIMDLLQYMLLSIEQSFYSSIKTADKRGYGKDQNHSRNKVLPYLLPWFLAVVSLPSAIFFSKITKL